VSRTIAFFRDAEWLTIGRVRVYASMIVALTVASIVYVFCGRGFEDPAGRAVGTDFVSFWSVSWALLNGHSHAIYDPSALAALERTLLPQGDAAFYAWQYPPIALLLVYPLATVPYLAALGIWVVTGLCGYLSAMWRVFPRPLALWISLGSPAVFLTITHGQNAFLTAALLTWGLLLLRDRPILAGILLGAVSFKPQLALLLPFALVAGRHWESVVAAFLAVLSLSLVTVIFFGTNIWRDFVSSTAFAHQMLELGLVPYFKMQSVFAAMRLSGSSLSAAYAAQGVAAILAAGMVAYIWRGSADLSVKSAAVLAATPLATPFVLDYDLLIMAPAIGLLARKIAQDGPLRWEGTVLVLAAMLPLVGRPIAEQTHLALAPVIAAALLAVITLRCHAERFRAEVDLEAGTIQARSERLGAE
jgi:Glycosyltransferase family 87